jgi:hypothetical protein
VEVVYDWKECRIARWRSARHVCQFMPFLFDIDYLFSYGMTSLGVRQYVLGIYKELGLEESQVTKVQTGGPDGDLGSSE